MEKVACKHGTPCVLKTGLSNKLTHGHSFYMCSHRKANCGFVQEVSVPLLACPIHNMPVGLRAWSKDDPNMISYFCSQRPKGTQWCGSMAVQDEEKENIDARTPESTQKTEKLPGSPSDPASGASRIPLAPVGRPPVGSGQKQTPQQLAGSSFHLSLDASTDCSFLMTSRDTSAVSECALDYSAAEQSSVQVDSNGGDEQDEGGRDDASEKPDEAEGSLSPEGKSRLSDYELDDSCTSVDDTSTESSLNTSTDVSLSEPNSVPCVVLHSDDDDDEGESTEGEVELMRTSLNGSPSLNSSPSLSQADQGGHLHETLDRLSLVEVGDEVVESSPQSSFGGRPPLQQLDRSSVEDGSGSLQSDRLLHSSIDANPALQHPDESSASLEPDGDSAGGSDSDSDSDVVTLSSESCDTSLDASQAHDESYAADASPVPHSTSPAPPSDSSCYTDGSSRESTPEKEEHDTSLMDAEAHPAAVPRSSVQDLDDEGGDSDEESEEEDANPSGQELEQDSSLDSKDSWDVSHSSSGGEANRSPRSEATGPVNATSPSVSALRVSQQQDVICLDTPDSKQSEVVCIDEPDYQVQPPTEEEEEEEGGRGREPEFKVAHQYRKLVKQYEQMEHLIRTMGANLPDKGALLEAQKKAILQRMAQLKRPVPPVGGGEGGDGSKLHFKGHLTHQAKMLTAGAVEHLHSSLANCPTEETLAEDPPGLMVSLMTHQRRALAWLQWRESQTPSGGILADDMGLGKTLSMLSLVLNGRVRERQEGGSDWVGRSSTDGVVRSAGTLVVCPASLMFQWEGEVGDKVERGRLSVKVYHGPSRTKSAVELSRYDVVMTTYNIVNVEGAACEDEDPTPGVPRKPKRRVAASTTLFQVHWRRVILDEAHVIRNPKSGTAIGVCRLKSDHRWAVTGTPIQNNLKDFYSLIKFIRLAPFDDFRVWKDMVERRGSTGMQRLNTMVSSLVLRRTKAEMSSELLQLTKREVETHPLQLSPEEQEVYDVLFAEAKKVFVMYLREQGGGSDQEQQDQSKKDAPFVPPDVARVVSSILRPLEGCTIMARSKGRSVLALLLRLRQCCSHLHLLTSALGKGEGDQDQVDLELAMGALSLQEEGGGASPGDGAIPERFGQDKASSKIKKVMQELKVIDGTNDSPPQKSIVVSQWTTMLNLMQYHLDRAGISYVRIDGSVPPKLRLAVVTKFNAPSKSPTVMLLSLQAGGVGLNLMGANHVFILDMHWNPALEEQAADRCHRVGQTRDVHIHRFVCNGTVEEKILNLQNKKLQLSQDVLSGASKHARNQNRLSLSDLKHLFDIS